MGLVHSMLVLSLIMVSAALAAEPATEDSVAVRLMPGAAVVISSMHGNITLEGWDSDLVSVSYTVGSHRHIRPDQVEMFVDPDAGIFCHVRQDPGTISGTEPPVDFLVMIPRDLELQIVAETFLGNIDMSSVTGTSLVEVVQGSIRLDSIRGELTVNLVSGDMEVIDSPGISSATIVEGTFMLSIDSLSDDVEISSVQGTIDLEVPEGIRVLASTIDGELESDGGSIKEGLFGRSLVFGSGERTVHVESFSGTIRVRSR